ncbi:apoptosis inhibitor 5 [Chrysoperla carnea]|uniref:apoptosis inhibitor 5 n=1 Tax=Chrysoperla carnea TaxID=189513 RepID=UPI001D069C55|nr:apoptosis inhibitor 5 [Chrysoperla carnea]
MTYTVDQLYSNCDELTNAKDKISEHPDKFQIIIDAAKNGQDPSVKKLASQLIGRFFKHFPSLHFQAFEAVFDLCEDDDVNIRKQSIRDLPNLCKDNKENTLRIADILAQLLQSDDPQEQNITANSLIAVITSDAPSAIKGIFQQMEIGDELVKERCFKFLSTKFKILGKEIITKEAEDVIIEYCKKFLESATGEEFKIIMQLLNNTHLPKTLMGQREIVKLIQKHADLDQPFDLHESNNYSLHMITLAVNAALPYLSSSVDSNAFMRYMCEQVLPHLEEMESLENGESVQVAILRQLAELATYTTNYEKVDESIESLFKKLLIYMPAPPTNGDLDTFPKQEFSFVECLLYAFHKLARFSPQFLTNDEERLKDFKLRLQYFARGLQGCIKKLNEKLSSDESLKKEKQPNELLQMTSNINTLIKDIFRSPPIYKANITLSWKDADATSNKTVVKTAPETNGTSVNRQKRHTPITFDSDSSPNKISRGNGKPTSSEQQKIYTPPSGKYSTKVSGYDGNRRPGRGSRPNVRGGKPSYRGSSRNWRF